MSWWTNGGGLFCENLITDQSKITRIILRRRNRGIHSRARILRFLWCTMIRVILDKSEIFPKESTSWVCFLPYMLLFVGMVSSWLTTKLFLGKCQVKTNLQCTWQIMTETGTKALRQITAGSCQSWLKSHSFSRWVEKKARSVVISL